jgi:Mrp family chromosome partitioning ATPase
MENLSALPCGPRPPNPAELLSSPIVAPLLSELRSQYDYVILDSPPVLSVSDSRILSTLTDAVVFVVRAERTPFDLVRRARSLVIGSGARVLGVVLNDAEIQRSGQYRFTYLYGRGYMTEGEGYSRIVPRSAS